MINYSEILIIAGERKETEKEMKEKIKEKVRLRQHGLKTRI